MDLEKLYVPMPLLEQMEPPAAELYVPVAQFEQEEAMIAIPVLKVPTEQREQVVANADDR